MSYQNGGQLREAVSLSKSLIKTSGNIVHDLTTGLADVIGGVTNGLELVAKKAGSTLNNLSKGLAITSTKVLRNVGGLGNHISKKLGKVIKVVPILGVPSAFVVKGAGKGVYFVVTTVGDVLGTGLKTVGHLGKQASNVVVFTIASTSGVTEKALKNAGKLVKNIAHSVNNKTKSKKKRGRSAKKRGRSAKKRGRSAKKRGRSAKKRGGRSRRYTRR